MKKSLSVFIACALAFGGLALWALWDSVAWTVPEIFLAGFALVLIGLAISV